MNTFASSASPLGVETNSIDSAARVEPPDEKFGTLPCAWALLLALFGGAGCGDRPMTPPASSGTTSAPVAKVAPAPPPPSVVPQPVLSPVTNMLPVKAGSFVRIRQPVTLTHDYWLGKYEVTQGEYAAVMGKNPSHFTGDTNQPVEKLSYLDAVAYCDELTRRERAAHRLPSDYEYRLPTEAEWEYACRAGTTNQFSFGDDPAAAEPYAWTLENSGSKPHPIGQKSPNAWGFYDLHGNVWEWCFDWFAPYPTNAALNPAGPAGGKFKVFRGGGWNQEAQFARSSNRFMMSPSNGIHFVGFRVALGRLAPRSNP